MNKATVKDKLATIIIDKIDVDIRAVNDGARIVEDLGADSLAVIEILMEIEETFGMDITDGDAENLLTVGALLEYVNDNHKLGSEPTPAKGVTVPFDEVSIMGYLDSAIKDWRVKRDGTDNSDAKTLATHYVDAYQSVRVSLFGELLP